MRWVFRLFVCVALLPLGAIAATDASEMTIRVLVGDDTAPPSTPTITSATPLSTSSIAVVWSTSTDNVAVDGYQLFRDSTQIATTSLTNFTDTGLSASTLYSYEVVAFDAANNFSSSSAAVATTTLAATTTSTTTPPTQTEDEGSTAIGSYPRISAFDKTLIPSARSALLTWSTNLETSYSLRWGQTTDYELGYVVTNERTKNHEAFVGDLAPGTTYYVELTAYATNAEPVTVMRRSFTTLAPIDAAAPSNVLDLTATVTGDDVQLSWQNPPDTDFAGVRVLRNHYFYPGDIVDGFLIYDGSGKSVVDQNALLEHERQFYTVYTYDTDGNRSSGAIVYVTRQDGEFRPDSRPEIPPDFSTSTAPEIGTSSAQFSVSDVVIWQGNTYFTLADAAIELLHEQPYTITIDTSVVPRELKTIIVTLTDPSDTRKSFSFLLTLNKAGTAYEATIAPSQVTGESRLIIDVYDFSRMHVTTAAGTIAFVEKAGSFPVRVRDAFLSLLPTTYWLGFVAVFVLAIMLLLLIVRRRLHDEDNPHVHS